MSTRMETSAPETICHIADAYIFIYADVWCDELGRDESKDIWQGYLGCRAIQKYRVRHFMFVKSLILIGIEINKSSDAF